MKKIRLREEALRKLIREMGGVYPDGQVDMSSTKMELTSIVHLQTEEPLKPY